MLSLDDAREHVCVELPALPAEPVPLALAAGRVLRTDIDAPVDLPVFDNSAMDGYAVQASSTGPASSAHPVILTLTGRLAAGEVSAPALRPGQCVRIFTGSSLPPGADAVVMQEDTRQDPRQPEKILVLEPVQPWQNVRLRGEDVKQGTRIARIGERLRAANLALLGAVGLGELAVSRQPVVGIISTGSELVEPGQPLSPGRTYESNRAMLATLARRAGAVPRIYPLVPDSREATERALLQALRECDVVVSSGGVSVGEFDLVKDSFQGLGGRLDFWQVSLRPGKPFVFGRWQDTCWFGLPGNPASALVTFVLLVRPALLRLQGCVQIQSPVVSGTLTTPLHNRGDRRHFVRVFWADDGTVRPTGPQASHMLHSLAAANGLVDVPPRTSLAAGTLVGVMLLED